MSNLENLSPGKKALALIEQGEKLPSEYREVMVAVLRHGSSSPLTRVVKKGLETDEHGKEALAIVEQSENLPHRMRNIIADVFDKSSSLINDAKQKLQKLEEKEEAPGMTSAGENKTFAERVESERATPTARTIP